MNPNNMNPKVLQISDDILPDSFVNKIVSPSYDIQKIILIRSNIKSYVEITQWVKEFGHKSTTQWNVRSSFPNGDKIVCSKRFICHQSAHMKVNKKRAASKNANCRATISVKIKKDTRHVRHKDRYAREGLFAVILIDSQHTHNLNTVESLRFLSADVNVQNTFYEYFNDGMSILEAHRYHRKKLELMSEDVEKDLVNGRVNPNVRTIRWWHSQWKLNLCPRTEEELLKKLKEEQIDYEEHGSTLSLLNVDNKDEITELLALEKNIPLPLGDSLLSLPTETSLKNGNAESDISPTESLISDIKIESASDDNEMRLICNELLILHRRFGSSSSGLAKFRERLLNISSADQWEQFLHTDG